MVNSVSLHGRRVKHETSTERGIGDTGAAFGGQSFFSEVADDQGWMGFVAKLPQRCV